MPVCMFYVYCLCVYVCKQLFKGFFGMFTYCYVIILGKKSQLNICRKKTIVLNGVIFAPILAKNLVCSDLGIHSMNFSEILCEVTRVNIWKKLLLAPKWAILTQIWPKNSYALFSESTLTVFLKFSTIISPRSKQK